MKSAIALADMHVLLTIISGHILGIEVNKHCRTSRGYAALLQLSRVYKLTVKQTNRIKNNALM